MRKYSDKRLRGGLVVVAMLIAAMLVLSACGGGGDSSSSTSEASSGSTEENSGGTENASGGSTPSGAPIKVGLFATLTSPYAAAGNAGGTVGPAWEEWVNSNGGINGHPVELILKDEAGDPAKAQKAAKEFVSEGVAAVILGSDYLATAYDDTLINAGIPVIAGPANVPDWFEKPGMFPTNGTPSALVGQVDVGVEFAKAKYFAEVYCAEIPSCGESVPPQKKRASELGIQFTSLSVSATQPNFTAECLALKEKGVDYPNINIPGAIAAKFVEECAQQGYSPTYGLGIQTIGPELLEVSGLKSFGPTDAFSTAAESPAIDEYREAMEAFAKDDNWHVGLSAFVWTGLKLFQQVAEGVSGNVTSEAVLSGLYEVKNDNLNGLVANPLTYTKGKASESSEFPCYFVQGIENEELIAPAGPEAVCPKS